MQGVIAALDIGFFRNAQRRIVETGLTAHGYSVM
jgi:hypothetical protein